ncbi:restriction endonuclease subunit S [Streptomyces sp. NPDC047973]|uniref:restriction endonuclease subunit S n=1 Tax=Streptomyces sp. NPDC047973 TaxID=3155383 RepID=UPI0034244CBE
MSQIDIAPWLAESRWPTVPIRLVARLGSGHTPSRSKPEYWTNCTEPWITLADVWQLRSGQTNVITETKEKVSKLGLANSSATLHPAQTVILSRTASVGFSAIMGNDMATSQDFATWTCGPRLDPRYLLHALRGMAPDLKRVATGSTHKTIYMPDIEQLRVPLPSMEEQRRIADFLDTETSRIDKLTKARRRQLSLLNARFEGAILSAIRGQEEPHPRTESRLDWLGSVPKDWPVMPVSYHFEVLLGKMLNQESARGPHLRKYLRNTNVQWDHIETDDLLLMNFPPEERNRYAIRPGDLLICEGGEPGRAAIWNGQVEEIYYQKALHRVRPRSYSSPRWLYYCLRAATSLNVFAVEGNATTISHLTGEQLRAHRFPFPQRKVQDRLVARLDASARAHTRLKRVLQEQLALLAERRQALITAAVTGQFDVSTASGRNVTDGVPTP